MSIRIQKILNKMARMRLGSEWSDYWQDIYNNAPFRIRKHFILEQFISPILSTKEFLREREALESKLTEKGLGYLIRKVCGGSNIGKFFYEQRMKKHHPEYDIHKNSHS